MNNIRLRIKSNIIWNEVPSYEWREGCLVILWKPLKPKPISSSLDEDEDEDDDTPWASQGSNNNSRTPKHTLKRLNTKAQSLDSQ